MENLLIKVQAEYDQQLASLLDPVHGTPDAETLLRTSRTLAACHPGQIRHTMPDDGLKALCEYAAIGALVLARHLLDH